MKKKIEVEENKKLNIGEIHISSNGITLITFAISRKCVRYEERAWKPCERREKERKV